MSKNPRPNIRDLDFFLPKTGALWMCPCLVLGNPRGRILVRCGFIEAPILKPNAKTGQTRHCCAEKPCRRLLSGLVLENKRAHQISLKIGLSLYIIKSNKWVGPIEACCTLQRLTVYVPGSTSFFHLSTDKLVEARG